LEVSDEVWISEPLLPVSERRLNIRPQALPGPQALRGILFVLRTGIP